MGPGARRIDHSPGEVMADVTISRQGKYGHGRYGGPPQVVVDLNSGGFEYVERVVDSALNFLEAEMTRIGL